jgi:hypothetical protein
MPTDRITTVDNDDSAVGPTRLLTCADDETGKAIAADLFRTEEHALVIEIWEGARLVAYCPRLVRFDHG